MRTAVYNRFWQSMGGGERYAGMIASTLAADGHAVDLLSPAEVDIDQLASHLSLDLSGVKVRVVEDDDESEIAAASADYDLFVTATYMSQVIPQSARSAYVCYFPTPYDHELTDRQRWLAQRLGPRVRSPSQIRGYGYGTGWYPPEAGLRQQWSWSDGHGVLELPHGGTETFDVTLGRPGATDGVMVTITDGAGEPVARRWVQTPFERVQLTVPASDRPRELHLVSDTFEPGGDNRALGIALSRRSGRSRLGPGSLLVRRMPYLVTAQREDRSFLEHYDSIVTISHYTQSWVTKLWHTDSDLLFPPIDVDKMSPSAERDKTIITIGRFFDPVRGHSKRQLEMVDIFRDLVSGGRLPGWTLHMVGGCEPDNRPYFEKVMAASDGLAIDLHPNAQRHTLERLINRASIFWSATGMNEDTERKPWRNEHFGMTTAEAMAAGCVPVVIDRAGQQEIVREGVDGYRWETAADAVQLTARVAADEDLRARLARSSMERARQFSDAAFSARWREICATRELFTTPGRTDDRPN